jgi:hypothetical protein
MLQGRTAAAFYSITSSARASSMGGTAMPNNFDGAADFAASSRVRERWQIYCHRLRL